MYDGTCLEHLLEPYTFWEKLHLTLQNDRFGLKNRFSNERTLFKIIISN